MKQQPTIHTDRLTLRPFSPNDAADTQRLAGEKAIADYTLSIPHPYTDGTAEQWIDTHQDRFEKGQGVVFAITHRQQRHLLGSIGLTISQPFDHAELGYWIGKPYWNTGYCTEAAQAVLAFGFDTLGLSRIHAHHIAENSASGTVMQKLGMTHEGRQRHHIKRWGRSHDIELYGILKTEHRRAHHTQHRQPLVRKPRNACPYRAAARAGSYR